MTLDVLEKTFPVSGKANLVLSNIRGSVDIAISSEDNIHVLAEKDIDSGDAENTGINLEQINDSTVQVQTSLNSTAGLLTWKKPCKVDYTVKVPSGCSVKISCVSSSCSINGELGEIKIKTVSGLVKLSNFNGSFGVESVSGNLSVENMNGALTFNTVSGDLIVKDSKLNSVRGGMVSGNAVVQSPLSEGPYDFRSVSGNVRLSLPEANGCIVRTSSISGRLRTDLQTNRSRFNGKDKEVELEGGGPLVRFSSISGDIHINYSGEGSRTEGAAVKKPIQEDEPERLEILSMIESGQISVEEGIERLKSL